MTSITSCKNENHLFFKIEIALVSTYALSIGTSKYVKQVITDIKGQYNNGRGPLTHYLYQWIFFQTENHKEILVFNDKLEQKNLTDIYWTFHPRSIEYIFFQFHIEHSLG